MVVKKYFDPDNVRMSGDIKIKFAKQLRSLRKEFNLTQEELADKSGISTKYLQNLESKNPKAASIVTIEKLAKGFGIPSWKIFQF